MNITFYDSHEEMMEALAEAMEAADRNVKEWQKAIKRGDCFRQKTEYGFDVFGKVVEDNYTDELQHYRFCKCYSEACPEGELGDVHISVISEIIPKERFEQARDDGWE